MWLCQGARRFGPFLRETSKGKVLFQSCVNEGNFLRIMPSGLVDEAGKGGPHCRFDVEEAADGAVQLCLTRKPKQSLGVSTAGALTSGEVAPAQRLFELQEPAAGQQSEARAEASAAAC